MCICQWDYPLSRLTSAYHVTCYLQSLFISPRLSQNTPTPAWIDFSLQSIASTSHGITRPFLHNDYFPRQYYLTPSISFLCALLAWPLRFQSFSASCLTRKGCRDPVEMGGPGFMLRIPCSEGTVDSFSPQAGPRSPVFAHVRTQPLTPVSLSCRAVTLLSGCLHSVSLHWFIKIEHCVHCVWKRTLTLWGLALGFSLCSSRTAGRWFTVVLFAFWIQIVSLFLRA